MEEDKVYFSDLGALTELMYMGIPVNMDSNPVESGGLMDLTPEFLEEAHKEDPGLFWVDACELDSVLYQHARRVADMEYDGVIQCCPVEERHVTILMFSGGQYYQAWDSSGLVDSGKELQLAEYRICQDLIGVRCSEQEFYEFCEYISENILGLKFVFDFSLGSYNSGESAEFMNENSNAIQTWFEGLEKIFGRMIAE